MATRRSHCRGNDRFAYSAWAPMALVMMVTAKQERLLCRGGGLQWPLARRILSSIIMKTVSRQPGKRVELGEYIVADPEICHGQPTFKGTRFMVWIVLAQISRGMEWDEIVKEWRGRVPRDAVAEAVHLASEVFKGDGTRRFRAHSRRKLSREPSLAIA